MSEPHELPQPAPSASADLDASVQAAPPSAAASVAAEAPAADRPVSGGAKTAAVWTVAGFVLMQVLRLGANIILARLLAPEVFGLMTVVIVFLQGLFMFSDIGLGPAIMQSQRGDDRDFLDTAWTLQVFRGFVLWFASILIAWPAADFYGEPVLMWLIPFVGFSQVMSGFTSTTLMTLSRRLYRGRLVLLEIGAYLSSISVTIFWVYHWRSVWPLAVGNLLSTAITVGFSHVLVPGYRNRLCWDRPALAELLHFGKWIFVSTLFAFLAGQTDRLVVGKLAKDTWQSLGLLGVYNFGAMLAVMPLTLMYALQAQLLVPVYGRHFQNGWSVRDAYVRYHPAAAGLTAILISGLIAAGPTLVRVLYDSRYYQAGWMLQILAVGYWLTALEAANGGVLWSMSRPQTSALSNGSKVVGLAVLAPLGYWLGHQYGGPETALVGMIVGFVASDLVRYAITAYVVHAAGMPCFRYDLGLTVLIAATSLPALWLAPQLWPYRVLAEGQKRDWANDLVRLVIEGAIVLLPWLLVALVAWRLGLFRKPAAPESKEVS